MFILSDTVFPSGEAVNDGEELRVMSKSVTVVVKRGDITTETTDAIVNSTRNFILEGKALVIA